MRLFFLDNVVDIHGSATADNAVEVFAVFAEPVAIGEEHKRMLPPDKLAAHGEDGAIGVVGAFFVEHLYCGLERVEHDDVLSEYLEMRHIAWESGSVPRDRMQGRGCAPNLFAHSVKVSHGFTEGMSSMLPRRGSGLGPGGKGAGFFFARVCLTRYTPTPARQRSSQVTLAIMFEEDNDG